MDIFPHLSDLVKSETLGHRREALRVVSQFRHDSYDIVSRCLQNQPGVETFPRFRPRIGLTQKLSELRHALQPAAGLILYIGQPFFRLS